MKKKSFLPVRVLLGTSTFLISVLMYVDRACIGAAKENISTEFSLTNIQWAWVMAAFTLGYALFQTPAGKMADKYGPRKVMSGIITLWSVLTALTGAAWSFMSMIMVRFLFGAGEAGAFPTLSKVVFKWFPVNERGTIQGINFSGSRLGGAIAYPIVVGLIAAVGWRFSFGVFGLLGVIVALVWWLFFKDSPEESKTISSSEKQYILENRQQASEGEFQKLPFLQMLKSKNMLMAMVQYIGSNFTFYFTLTWMFPYLKEALKESGTTASFYAMAPLIGGAIGNWVSGIMVDKIYSQTGNLKLSRKVPAIIGFTLATIGVILMTHADSNMYKILFLTIAIFGADMTLSPSWSFCIDIGKEHAGSVSGTMNMAGNIGAFTSILVFGYLADSLIRSGANPKEALAGNNMFFYICAVLSVISIVMWLFMNPNKAIQDK